MANEKTLQLSDVLKSSQEVTALGGSDRILAIDSNGVIKKTSRESIVNNGTCIMMRVAKQGWYRIASFSATQTTSVVFCITSGWHYFDPYSVILHGYIVGDSINASPIRIVSGLARSNGLATVTKIRLVKTASGMFIDLWYNVNKLNAVSIESLSGIRFLNSIEEAILPSDAEAKEIDLVQLYNKANSGGVKFTVRQTVTISVPHSSTIQRKGGRHERKDNGTIRRHFVRANVKCDDLPWKRTLHRRLPEGWNLSLERKLHNYMLPTIQQLELRLVGSDGKGKRCVPKNHPRRRRNDFLPCEKKRKVATLVPNPSRSGNLVSRKEVAA